MVVLALAPIPQTHASSPLREFQSWTVDYIWPNPAAIISKSLYEKWQRSRDYGIMPEQGKPCAYIQEVEKNKIMTDYLWRGEVASVFISNINCDKILVIRALWIRWKKREKKSLKYSKIKEISKWERKTKLTKCRKRQKNKIPRLLNYIWLSDLQKKSKAISNSCCWGPLSVSRLMRAQPASWIKMKQSVWNGQTNQGLREAKEKEKRETEGSACILSQAYKLCWFYQRESWIHSGHGLNKMRPCFFRSTKTQ